MGFPQTTGPHATLTYTLFIWRLIVAMTALTLASFLLTGVRVDPFSHPLLFVPFAVLCATRWFYGSVRPDVRLQVFSETCLQLLLILLLGTVLSYVAASLPLPFQDDTLYAIDSALGLDRKVYFDFFRAHPWLYSAVRLAYFAMMPQFVVVLLVLFLTNQPRRLQQFTFAVGLALFATDAISALTPSVTTVYLDLGLPVHAEVPSDRYTPVPTLQALRSGAPYYIQLNAIEGLISFPSFHTIGALLFVWALSTVAYVRWIALAVNAALIVATPIVGAHYFIDLAGGAAVALCAVAAARWLSRPATVAVVNPQANESYAPAGSRISN